MKIVNSLVVGLACALAVAGTAEAQNQPKKFVRVLTVHAKPDGAQRYEAFVKRVKSAAETNGQKQAVLAYQGTSGGPSDTYKFHMGFDNWAEADEIPTTLEILTKALGQEEGAKLLLEGRASIESMETHVYRLLPELCTKIQAYHPPAPFIHVVRHEVKPETNLEWLHLNARYSSAAEHEPDAPTVMRYVAIEGPGDLYVTVIPYTTGAEQRRVADHPGCAEESLRRS